MERELEEVAARYQPCTATPAETGELVEATARVQFLGGDSSSGDQLISEYIDIYERRANDDPIPECESLGFSITQPVPKWDGEMGIELHTCDGLTWQGRLTVDATFDSGGGSLAQVGSADLTVTLPSESATRTGPITFSRTVSIAAAEATGSHVGESSGTLTLTVDRDAGTAQAEVALDASMAQIEITAGGRTVTLPWPVDPMSATFDAPLEVVAACE